MGLQKRQIQLSNKREFFLLHSTSSAPNNSHFLMFVDSVCQALRSGVSRLDISNCYGTIRYLPLLWNPGPATRCSKAGSPETSVGREGKVALLWRLATGGEGGLPSENQPPIAAQGTGAFKGEFKGCIGRGREQNSI